LVFFFFKEDKTKFIPRILKETKKRSKKLSNLFEKSGRLFSEILSEKKKTVHNFINVISKAASLFLCAESPRRLLAGKRDHS
jgi:hypothetical protein